MRSQCLASVIPMSLAGFVGGRVFKSSPPAIEEGNSLTIAHLIAFAIFCVLSLNINKLSQRYNREYSSPGKQAVA